MSILVVHVLKCEYFFLVIFLIISTYLDSWFPVLSTGLQWINFHFLLPFFFKGLVIELGNLSILDKASPQIVNDLASENLFSNTQLVYFLFQLILSITTLCRCFKFVSFLRSLKIYFCFCMCVCAVWMSVRVQKLEESIRSLFLWIRCISLNLRLVEFFASRSQQFLSLPHSAGLQACRTPDFLCGLWDLNPSTHDYIASAFNHLSSPFLVIF